MDISKERRFIVERFAFNGLHGCPSECGLEMVVTADWVVVIASELGDNPGTSVTNAWEILAPQILRSAPFPWSPNIAWIEHYPKRDNWPKYAEERFDLVVMEVSRDKVTPNIITFYKPKWRRMDRDDWIELGLTPRGPAAADRKEHGGA